MSGWVLGRAMIPDSKRSTYLQGRNMINISPSLSVHEQGEYRAPKYRCNRRGLYEKSAIKRPSESFNSSEAVEAKTANKQTNKHLVSLCLSTNQSNR